MAGRMAGLLLLLLIPGSVLAGPYLGEWDWLWHPDRDCPKGEYPRLHYWVPEVYWLRRNIHPSNLDQFPPGPSTPVCPGFESTRLRCTTTPPTPTTPYSDPAGYFRRQEVPGPSRKQLP